MGAFAGFQAERDRLLAAFAGVAGICEQFGLDAAAVREGEQDLRDGRFQVVVVGEFNRGKSTLINALLGARILPDAIRPTTAAINIIRYGEPPRATVRFLDGRPAQEVAVGDLRQYTTALTPEAEATAASVRDIVIHYPCSLCGDGVELVDTPGVNDINEAREEVTFQYIPRSDAAVMLLDAGTPMTASEYHFLKTRILGADIRKLFFVANRADDLQSEADRQAVREEIDRHLAALPGAAGESKVFLVSARQALRYRTGTDPEATGLEFDRFEHALEQFLVEEKGRVMLDAAGDRLNRRAGEVADALRLRSEAMGLTVSDLAREEERFQAIVDRVRVRHQALLAEIAAEGARLGQEVAGAVPAAVDAMLQALKEELPGFEGELEQFPQFVQRALDRQLKVLAEKRLAPLLTEKLASIGDRTAAELQAMIGMVRRFHTGRVAVEVEAPLVNVTVPGKNGLVKWGGAITILLLVGDLLSGGLGIASWLFGNKLGGAWVEWMDARRTEKALTAVLKACDAMREQLVAKQTEAMERQLAESTAKLAADVTAEIERVVADYSRTLADVAQKKREAEGAWEAERARTQAAEADLKELRESLRSPEGERRILTEL